MTAIQHQFYSNTTSKKTISKVTTNKSTQISSPLAEDLAKSEAFQTLYPLQPQRFLKSARKTMVLFPQYTQNQPKHTKNNSYQQTESLIGHQVWKFTISILDRFNFNYETISLGIAFYLKLILSSDYQQQKPIYLKKFHMSGCIYLAAKAIQIQSKLPKPTAYQYFCGQNYTSEDYNRFQRMLVSVLQYDLQKATIITFLNVYLSMGVFYQNQIFETGKQIQQLENEILQNGLESLKKCKFLLNQNGNPQIQAINIIKDVRKKYFLAEQSKNIVFFTQMNKIQKTLRKKSQCLSLTQSMGNFFNSSQSSSFYTHRIKNQDFLENSKSNKKEPQISRKKSKLVKKNSECNSGSQILKRKPIAEKLYRKKQYFEELDQFKAKTYKYVALKDESSRKQNEEKIKRQFIKCKSTTDIVTLQIKYQKCNLKMSEGLNYGKQGSEKRNEKNSQILQKLQQNNSQKTRTSLLKSSKSLQYLSAISQQNVRSMRKLSKLSQVDEDRIIQKSRSRSKSGSVSKYQQQNSLSGNKEQRYFRRKNSNSNNSSLSSSLKMNIVTKSYYRNR